MLDAKKYPWQDMWGSVTPQWFPINGKARFAPAETEFNGDKEPHSAYLEYRMPVESRGIDQQIGVYMRPQESDSKKGEKIQNSTMANLPPILVAVGGLGFGGPYAANSWRNYLPNWNPILVDARGAGNSYPLGNLQDNTPDRTLDDIDALIAQTGLKEISFVGYSFAGNLALKAAQRAVEKGIKVPFVAVTSPVLCTTDRDWCFDRLAKEASGENAEDIRAAWNKLMERVTVKPGQKTADAVLETYDRLLNRNTDPNDFLDATVRMYTWESRPYKYPLYTVDQYKEILARGSTIPVDQLIEKLMKGQVDVRTDFKEISTAKSTEARQELNESWLALRWVANIKIWTNAWNNNCWEDPAVGITPTLESLRKAGVPGLICLNRQDPLVPSGQESMWKKAWPEAVQIFETDGHGLADKSVNQAFYHFLEEQRVKLGQPDNARNNQLRTTTRYVETDLRDAVSATLGANGSIKGVDPLAIAALGFMLSPGGEKGAAAKTTETIIQRWQAQTPSTSEELKGSSQLVAWAAENLNGNFGAENFRPEPLRLMKTSPEALAREVDRLAYLAIEKRDFLLSRETKKQAVTVG